MKNIVEIRGICKTYAGFKLNNISFDIPTGAIVGMIGSNGSGKTSIIKSILNLIDIDKGEVKVLGMNNNNTKFINERIGVVFDECNFPDNYNIKILNKIFKSMYSQWDTQLFSNYVNRFKLDIKQNIGNFSKGMKMKLAIAAALSHCPRLLILDEALAGLDPIARDEMIEIIFEYMESGENSILITSHITTDLEKIADYIIFIDEGEKLWFENTSKLLDEYGIVRCGPETFEQIESSDILCYRKQDLSWSVLVNSRSKAEEKYKNIVVDKPTIEEIMMLYVKGVKNEIITN